MERRDVQRLVWIITESGEEQNNPIVLEPQNRQNQVEGCDNEWAYGTRGHCLIAPNLPGEWIGELVSRRAAWCDDRGRRMENLAVTGYVPSYTGYTWSAEKVTVQIDSGKSPPVGLLPSHLEGNWQQDTITLEPDFFYTGQAARTIPRPAILTRPSQ